MDEIPLLHGSLLVLHDRRARAAQDEEVLLCLLGVVERGVLARPDHREVDADLREAPVVGLEQRTPSETAPLDPPRRRGGDVDHEPPVRHARTLLGPACERHACETGNRERAVRLEVTLEASLCAG